MNSPLTAQIQEADAALRGLRQLMIKDSAAQDSAVLPIAGRMYWNTTTAEIRVWNGTKWSTHVRLTSIARALRSE